MKCYIRDENKEKNFKEYYKDIRFYFKKCLKHLKITKDYEVTLIINNDEAIKKINRDYRGIDKATDVLSFASLEGEAPLDENYLGDIFISKDKIISQAKKYHHSIKREFIFLFIHGLLHCLGYDHLNEDDEAVMFSLQDEILKGLK